VARKTVYELSFSYEAPDLIKSERAGKIVTQFFEEGEMIIYQERYDEYRWAIYLGNGTSNMKKIVVSNDKRDIFQPKEVYGHTLFKFPEGETIKQNTVNGIRYDSNFTIETYNFNN